LKKISRVYHTSRRSQTWIVVWEVYGSIEMKCEVRVWDWRLWSDKERRVRFEWNQIVISPTQFLFSGDVYQNPNLNSHEQFLFKLEKKGIRFWICIKGIWERCSIKSAWGWRLFMKVLIFCLEFLWEFCFWQL